MSIRPSDYFFAAFMDPFKSPARVAVNPNDTPDRQKQGIKLLKESKIQGFPMILQNKMFRIATIFLLYIVSTVTIVPIITLVIIAKKAVRKCLATMSQIDKKVNDVKTDKRIDLEAKFSRRTSNKEQAPVSLQELQQRQRLSGRTERSDSTDSSSSGAFVDFE